MSSRTIQLSEYWVTYLVSQPENGMGYQIVKVILKSGKILHQHKIINSEILILEENEDIIVEDIDKIELEKK